MKEAGGVEGVYSSRDGPSRGATEALKKPSYQTLVSCEYDDRMSNVDTTRPITCHQTCSVLTIRASIASGKDQSRRAPCKQVGNHTMLEREWDEAETETRDIMDYVLWNFHSLW